MIALVRKGTSADFPQALEAAPKFFAEAPPIYQRMPISRLRLSQTLDSMVEQDLFLVAHRGSEVIGYTGALIGPTFWSFDLLACELFWWIEPANRGRYGLKLFIALEEAARAAGARFLAPLALMGRNFDELENFYLRRGYQPFESAFIKEL